jgi:hypothetical protein
MQFLTESDHCGAEATDKGLKNRWRWSLLSEKDKDGIDWREWCKKIDIAGMCFCIVCSKTIRYGTTGKKSLRLHLLSIFDFKNPQKGFHSNFNESYNKTIFKSLGNNCKKVVSDFVLDYSKNLKYLKNPRPKFSGISKCFTFTHEYVHCYQEKRFIST